MKMQKGSRLIETVEAEGMRNDLGTGWLEGVEVLKKEILVKAQGCSGL